MLCPTDIQILRLKQKMIKKKVMRGKTQTNKNLWSNKQIHNSLTMPKTQRTNYHHNNKKKSGPFCKVCFDSGEPESVYTSHYVKDARGPNGQVVCRKLLALICGYCKKNGHTVKYCPVLKERDGVVSNDTYSVSKCHHHSPHHKTTQCEEKPVVQGVNSWTTGRLTVNSTPKQLPTSEVVSESQTNVVEVISQLQQTILEYEGYTRLLEDQLNNTQFMSRELERDEFEDPDMAEAHQLMMINQSIEQMNFEEGMNWADYMETYEPENW